MFSSVRLVSRFAAEMRNSPEIRREKILPDCLPMTLMVSVGTRANLNCIVDRADPGHSHALYHSQDDDR